MGPKHKPRPLVSFIEDDFELGEVKKNAKIYQNKPTQLKSERNRDYTILIIRLVMALIAGAIAVWLYILVDNFVFATSMPEMRYCPNCNPAYEGFLLSSSVLSPLFPPSTYSPPSTSLTFSYPSSSCTIYVGLSLTSSKMRPIYSPISPKIISTIP